jgi:DNA-binding response OmpR family regulator
MDSQKKILLVEDDQGLASVYVTRLEAEGFSVLHVPNGEDALSKTLEFKPDLIILDVMMPKISGFDVLDILRNTPETANVRIIMLTALSQESDMEKAKGLGVDDYLVKSQVVIADVVERIKYHLGMGGTPPPPDGSGNTDNGVGAESSPADDSDDASGDDSAEEPSEDASNDEEKSAE